MLCNSVENMKFLLVVALVGFLGVQGQNAPAVVIRPPDTNTATETQTVRFTCAAYGAPTPTISWFRNSEDLKVLAADPNSGITITWQTITVNGVVFAASVLEMCGVNQTSNTQFTCTAANGVFGSSVAPSSASFSLTVTSADQQPAAIVVRPSDQTDVDYGSTIEAVCVAYGNPLPTITWTKTSCTDTNCDISEGMGDALITNDVVSYGDVSFTRSTLRLCSVESTDSGTFQCAASNGVIGQGVGVTFRSFQLSVNDQVLPTTSTATVRPSTSSTDDGGSTETLRNVATERAYQVVVAIETIVVVFLIVVIVVLIFVAYKTINKRKEKATIEMPGFGRAQATNPIYDEPPRDRGPQDIDNMTYAELADQMGGGGGDDMGKSLID